MEQHIPMLAALLALIVFLYKTNKYMATIAQLQEAVASINTTVAAVGTKVQALETQIASSIYGSDSDALLASLTTLATSLQAIANG